MYKSTGLEVVVVTQISIGIRMDALVQVFFKDPYVLNPQRILLILDTDPKFYRVSPAPRSVTLGLSFRIIYCLLTWDGVSSQLN